jgi:hypothetical protein
MLKRVIDGRASENHSICKDVLETRKSIIDLILLFGLDYEFEGIESSRPKNRGSDGKTRRWRIGFHQNLKHKTKGTDETASDIKMTKENPNPMASSQLSGEGIPLLSLTFANHVVSDRRSVLLPLDSNLRRMIFIPRLHYYWAVDKVTAKRDRSIIGSVNLPGRVDQIADFSDHRLDRGACIRLHVYAYDPLSDGHHPTVLGRTSKIKSTTQHPTSIITRIASKWGGRSLRAGWLWPLGRLVLAAIGGLGSSQTSEP